MQHLIEGEDKSIVEKLTKEVELLKESVDATDVKYNALKLVFDNFTRRVCKNADTDSEVSRLSNDIYILKKRVEELSIRQKIHENASYDGRLLWKVDNISSRMMLAEKGEVTALHSAPTYTNRYGYKFCARLYLNGDGIGRKDYISLFFVIMKSEYDELQEWPFYNEVTLRLLNLDDLEKSISESFMPDRESPSFMKPRIDMNIASGCPRLLQKSKLLNDGFVKNDCIYIEVTVM